MTEPALPYFKSEIPEGQEGEWRIERFVVRQPEVADPRPPWFQARPGRYTRLKQDSTVYMTDLYDEWWTQRRAVQEAVCRGGRVLVTGLGLGLIIESMLRPDDLPIESVTVIERSPDVIRLVAPHLLARYGARLRVVQADAFRWKPELGERFTVGWHDIWPNPLDAAVFPEIDRLHRHYQNCCDWQWSWPTDYLEAANVELLADGTLERRS